MSHSTRPADYRAALTTPGARGPVVASLLGRLPIAMVGLSLLLYVQNRTGSIATASLVSAGSLIGVAIGSAAQSRIMDRAGPSRPLLVTASLFAVFVALTIVAVERHAATFSLVVLGFAVGLTEPMVGSASRAMWTRLVPPGPTRDAALVYEAISLEVFFIAGPAVSGLLIRLPWPGAGVVVGAACLVIGAVWFALTATIRQSRPERTGRKSTLLGPLAHPGMRTVAIAAMGFGAVIGFVEVAIPAAAIRAGDPGAGGLLLGLLSISSVAFGVVYGLRPWPRPIELRMPVLLGGFAVMVGLLAIPTSMLWLALVTLVAGLLVTPQATTHSAVLEVVAPPETATEAFGWVITSVTVGIALGQLTSGQLVKYVGLWSSYVAATLMGLAFAAVVYARRKTVTRYSDATEREPALAV
ncbi:MFS transporter [Actinokineospora auranticolor]|uniref:Putative MFS family arabinose efflux permease n=1 Tax=Actinokineospora auranticolor TaxID=155976 RepID=A0A2S6GKP1_9PSEU|nr:MFS transporter [Actinokineospora auranticolor]PPK65808.1 putative MFS family arabinose efflux permease [Actinokineospora auranticolor]